MRVRNPALEAICQRMNSNPKDSYSLDELMSSVRYFVEQKYAKIQATEEEKIVEMLSDAFLQLLREDAIQSLSGGKSSQLDRFDPRNFSAWPKEYHVTLRGRTAKIIEKYSQPLEE